MKYPALIDGEAGAFGVVFPDLQGIAAMGDTVEEAISNAKIALQEYVREAISDDETIVPPSLPNSIEAPPGSQIIVITLDPEST